MASKMVNGKIVALSPEEQAEYDARPAPTVPPAIVKAEAQRRILAIMPEHEQRNYTAMAAEVLFDLRETGRDLTQQEQAMLADGRQKFAQIKAIRAASNAIEASDPIPLDFQDDRHWP